jgi:hypothetical protein
MTIKQFQALERRIERAEVKMGEVESETAYESIRYRHDVLQKAMSIAENRIYGWIFSPSLSLEMTTSLFINKQEENTSHSLWFFSLAGLLRVMATVKESCGYLSRKPSGNF